MTCRELTLKMELLADRIKRKDSGTHKNVHLTCLQVKMVCLCYLQTGYCVITGLSTKKFEAPPFLIASEIGIGNDEEAVGQELALWVG